MRPDYLVNRSALSLLASKWASSTLMSGVMPIMIDDMARSQNPPEVESGVSHEHVDENQVEEQPAGAA